MEEDLSGRKFVRIPWEIQPMSQLPLATGALGMLLLFTNTFLVNCFVDLIKWCYESDIMIQIALVSGRQTS